MTSEKSDPLIEKLIRRLSDPSATERRNAAGALRLHGRRAACAVGELIRLLNDSDSAVRAEAQRALDRLNQSAA
ncbi:MAG: HEAT repeat domain-containing protein [Pirellulales bacterium]|nr:HEAT repeat domain-containing protein [Pirellulales bacterium]